MKRSCSLHLLTMAVTAGALGGCGDHADVRDHEVTIEVSDAASGEPVTSGLVLYQSIRGPERRGEPELTEEAALDEFHDSSWTTITDGQATLTLSTSSWCTWAETCRAPSVTGGTYLIRVDTDAASELLTMEIRPGETVVGEHYSITVLSVS